MIITGIFYTLVIESEKKVARSLEKIEFFLTAVGGRPPLQDRLPVLIQIQKFAD